MNPAFDIIDVSPRVRMPGHLPGASCPGHYRSPDACSLPRALRPGTESRSARLRWSRHRHVPGQSFSQVCGRVGSFATGFVFAGESDCIVVRLVGATERGIPITA